MKKRSKICCKNICNIPAAKWPPIFWPISAAKREGSSRSCRSNTSGSCWRRRWTKKSLIFWEFPMADIKGFIKIKREKSRARPVCERVKDYGQVMEPRTVYNSREQASRCMDCGTPFCHSGCPIGNYIPEWNDQLFQGRWEAALNLLAATN